MMRQRLASLLLVISAGAALVGLALLGTPAAAAERAVVLEINGAIGPPIADYIARELNAAASSSVGSSFSSVAKNAACGPP